MLHKTFAKILGKILNSHLTESEDVHFSATNNVKLASGYKNLRDTLFFREIKNSQNSHAKL